jgi:glycosyltransferase involved in cell wall biosynthesis
MSTSVTSISPRVSVVLPTYNQAGFLPAALDSILGQTWHDFELIVVNDGSTDETPRILEDYRERYGFTVIHQENKKLPRTLNVGFRRARGEYLTWTSSDNVMQPDMLATLIGALDLQPDVGLVYADWQVIDEHGAILGTVQTLDYDPHLLMRMNYINACFMYRRACQDAVGFYDPDFMYRMQRIPQVLYQYRVHGQSLTQTQVLTGDRAPTPECRKLLAHLKADRRAWILSKIKYEWRRLRLRRDPGPRFFPAAKGGVE